MHRPAVRGYHGHIATERLSSWRQLISVRGTLLGVRRAGATREAVPVDLGDRGVGSTHTFIGRRGAKGVAPYLGTPSGLMSVPSATDGGERRRKAPQCSNHCERRAGGGALEEIGTPYTQPPTHFQTNKTHVERVPDAVSTADSSVLKRRGQRHLAAICIKGQAQVGRVLFEEKGLMGRETCWDLCGLGWGTWGVLNCVYLGTVPSGGPGRCTRRRGGRVVGRQSSFFVGLRRALRSTKAGVIGLGGL